MAGSLKTTKPEKLESFLALLELELDFCQQLLLLDLVLLLKHLAAQIRQ